MRRAQGKELSLFGMQLVQRFGLFAMTDIQSQAMFSPSCMTA